MAWRFSPPSVNDGAAYRADADVVTRKLWGHMARHNTGVSILKTNGVYVEQQYVYHDDVVAADIFYQGGHIYEVDDAEAQALVNAGYDVERLDGPYNHANLYAGTEAVGGAGCEENLLVTLDGEERVLTVNPYEIFGWSVDEGRYPTLIVKSKVGADWVYDEARSKWADDVRAEGDPTLIDQLWRQGFNSYNQETVSASMLPTEAGQFPDSGHIVVGHYDVGAVKDDTFANTRAELVPTWGTLSTSGGFSIFDDDLVLVGSYLLPNLTDPVTGCGVSMAPRGMSVDPTCTTGDERWVCLYDTTFTSDPADGTHNQMNVASPAVVADDLTFEGGLGGWTGTFATLTQSATFAYAGANSMRVAPQFAGTSAQAGGPRFRVRQNKNYVFSARVRAGTTARNIKIGVQWRNSAGNQLGVAIYTGVGTTDAVGSWTLVTSDTFLAPSGAYTAEILVVVVTPAGGEFHYIDAPYAELTSNLAGTAATFCMQEFSWDGSTVTAITQPFSPGPQASSIQNIHAIFDDAGNLWVARAGGTFLSNLNALIFEKTSARSYEATVPIDTAADWVGDVQTPGPCDTSTEWGYEAVADYEVTGTNVGGIPTRQVWDPDRSVMHVLTISSSITSIHRGGTAGSYAFTDLGDLYSGAEFLPEVSSAYGTVGNPVLGGFACYDSDREVIWSLVQCAAGGAWPHPPEEIRCWMARLDTNHDTVDRAIDYYGLANTFTGPSSPTSSGHTIDTHEATGFPISAGQRPQRPVVTADGLVHLASISQRGNNAQATAAAGLGLYTWDPDTQTMTEELVRVSA
jgi:hypothetical protein